MWKISFRFELVRVTIGGIVMTAAAGLFTFSPSTRIIAEICFSVGFLVTADGLVRVGKSGPIIHRQWSSERIFRALSSADKDTTVQILQTWFPEENFVTSLERLYTAEKKKFRLRVMIIDPHDVGAIDVLAARVKLRGIDRARAVLEVTASLNNLCDLKRNVDAVMRASARNGDFSGSVDLQIRLYDFLPFGPIYKIGEEVMFVGFYLSHVSSVHGPMVEVRKDSCPALWHVFEEDFRRGWEGSTTYKPRGKVK